MYKFSSWLSLHVNGPMAIVYSNNKSASILRLEVTNGHISKHLNL